MATRIHPLAHVDPAAQIADDVEIGPFCTVGPDVSLGAGCRLVSHVHVAGHTTIGARTQIHPHAAVGTPPQSTSYRGGPTRLTVGADCVIRESVTMNIGTEEGGGLTQVGDHGFFMAYAHIGHDCRVGQHVIFANSATLGGHCEIGDHVFMGGLSAVHQFARVGTQAMVGALSGVRGDVIPFGMVSGSVARLVGLNTVGMKRRGLPPATRSALQRAYHMLFLATGSLEERLTETETALGSEPAVALIIAFIRGRRKRNICRPGSTDER